MKVSVIIPTYKPGDYIYDCLNSVYKQTLGFDEYEVLVVLNGCGEPWREKLNDYLSRNYLGANYRIIYTETPGVSNARNLGIDDAIGDYIAFIDDDDYVSPTYLEELLSNSDTETVGLSYVYAFLDGNDREQVNDRATDCYMNNFKKGKQPFTCVRSYFSGPCMKLIHKDIIQKKHFDTRLKVGEDTTFMFLISDRIKKAAFTTKDAIYYRRIRKGSAITTHRSFLEKFKSNATQIGVYFVIMLRHPFKYNWWFFITRCLGSIRGFFI